MAPTQSSLSWVCVGSGAIGLLASARLQLAGYNITLWLKQPAQINLQFTDSKQQSQHLLLLPQPHTLAISRLLVPVKAHQVMQAVTELLPYLADNAQLVLSTNGIIPFEPLIQQLKPKQGLWFLSTSQAAYKPAPYSLVHSGAGSSFLTKLTPADNSGNEQDVIAAMSSALGPLTLVSDIYPLLWQKLAVNVAINPLSALENCQNGQLAAARYRPQITTLVTEVCKVATALGYPMTATTTIDTVYQVIAATALNYSSMHQDVQARRQTEINDICGYVCQQAAQLQLATPANQHMLNAIQALSHY
jgi:2-dehydropantoate 2-reductase